MDARVKMPGAAGGAAFSPAAASRERGPTLKKIEPRELDAESFARYGAFAAMIEPDHFHFGAEPIQFFRDMLQVELGGRSAVSFSVCRVAKRPMAIEKSEYHGSCGEGILPLDADVIIHVAPATRPDFDFFGLVEAFRVPRGVMVTLRPGVWHHAPFVVGADRAHVLIALPERAYANDCGVREHGEDHKIVIE